MMPAEKIKFDTARLHLRPFVAADLPLILAGLSNPLVKKYYGISLHSMPEAQQQLRWYHRLQKEDSGRWMALFKKHDSTFIGAIGFNNRHQIPQKAEIGFWILPEFWQQGFASEAMQSMLEFAFLNWRLHRIEAQCFVKIEFVNTPRTLSGAEVSGRVS